MNMLTVTFTPDRKKARVEVDAEKFERLTAALGLFNADFVKSLERSEREISAGKTRALKSLKDLRRP